MTKRQLRHSLRSQHYAAQNIQSWGLFDSQ